MDLGRLAPVSEVAEGHTILKLADHALPKMVRYVLDPVTSEAGARRPRSISN
jgi:hypothetical protein